MSAIERFPQDIAQHVVTILRDDGVYRHLRCARPGSGVMAFEIVTWPGRLAYCGDMGAYVFERLPDMFTFFRADTDRPGCINPSYWAEKVAALDRDGITEYSPAKFRAAIEEHLAEFIEDRGMAEDEATRLREEVEVSIRYQDEDEWSARAAADGFKHHGRRVFSDFYEIKLHEYTFRFLWCCQALVWAIARYDEQKARTAQGVPWIGPSLEGRPVDVYCPPGIAP